ncbi:MAG: S9 family peptidase, partial [Pseudomonadota bacterium]
MRALYLLPLLLAVPAVAEIPTPERPLTDPKSLVSPSDRLAAPVPLDDLVFSRGMLGVTWSADGRRLFVSTNLTGRYNIWRTDTAGSWPVQLTQSEDAQQGLVASPDGRTLYYRQDKGGNERYDVYAVPTDGGAPRNLTNTPDIREDGLVIAPDGRSIALWTKHGQLGAINAAVMDVASGKVRELTNEADTSWEWSPVAWADGGKAIIANRSFADGSAGEVWKIDVASGKATKILGKPDVIYNASGATPDGSAIAITTNEQTKQLHAALYRAASGALETLKPTPWEQQSSAISPDGRSMLVLTGEDGRQAVETVDVATRAEHPLALPPGVNFAEAQPFSPDSRSLLLRAG